MPADPRTDLGPAQRGLIDKLAHTRGDDRGMLRAALMPYRDRMSKLILSSLLICALVPACDTKEEDKKDDKKVEEKSDADKEVEARLAAKRAAREAEAKAAEDKVAAIKALATLPETMPKNLEAACTGLAEAQDAFMKKHYEGEGLERWEAAKDGQLGMLKTSCIKAASVEVPACQINAMNNAPTEFKKDLPDILKACVETFPAAAPG